MYLNGEILVVRLRTGRILLHTACMNGIFGVV